MSDTSDSSDDDYLPIPHMPPCRHDAEAGTSSSAPPAPQIDPALLAILEWMRQDQACQAQEIAATFAQFQARQDEFQGQQQAIQQQQQLLDFM